MGARTGLEPPGAYLFVDDDDEVLRFRLDADRVRIGRDEGNDIWLDHPTVPPHALVIYKRDGIDNIKVYEGAKVDLNGVVIAGMHRLYSGDRIGVADREFFYARDDTPAEVALGVTVIAGEEALRAMVIRRTRVAIGRREGDLPLFDPSISERHLILECYSADALFAHNIGGIDGITVGGEPLGERRRVRDGALISLGRLTLRLRVLPADANGLLVGLIRRRTTEEIAGTRKRFTGAPAQPIASPPPAASLAPAPESPRRAADRGTGPQAQRSDSWKPQPAAYAPPAPEPRAARPARARRELPEGPSVRVRPEVYERSRAAIDPRDAPQMRAQQEQERRYGSGRITGRNDGGTNLPPQRKASQRRSGFHEQLTEVVQTGDVQRLVEAHYRDQGAGPDAWLNADEGRYRPSKESSRRPTGDPYEPPPVGPGNFDVRSGPPGFAPASKAQLTNVLDIAPPDRPRLDHDVVGLDPDAMPQQLRDQQRRAPVVPPIQGYSHHDPARMRQAAPPPEDNDWDEIDAAQRRYRKFEVDNSPRYRPDEDD